MNTRINNRPTARSSNRTSKPATPTFTGKVYTIAHKDYDDDDNPVYIVALPDDAWVKKNDAIRALRDRRARTGEGDLVLYSYQVGAQSFQVTTTVRATSQADAEARVNKRVSDIIVS